MSQRELPVDENLPPRVAELLSKAGHNAVHVRDLHSTSAPDATIMELAVQGGRLVVSADTDLGALLAYSRATEPSVILVRELIPLRPPELVNIIVTNLEVLQAHLESGAVAVGFDSRSRRALLGALAPSLDSFVSGGGLQKLAAKGLVPPRAPWQGLASLVKAPFCYGFAWPAIRPTPATRSLRSTKASLRSLLRDAHTSRKPPSTRRAGGLDDPR
ncbi:hypothetical protein GT755_27205 [Herbidospora sp. NEAU-GS84]|uniref:DUF5615 domain-containing protein n=1 Tax=Herbidospora solisilvae TaxID=2696284 RepID=A0A7C9J6T7_9ACTN|nr:hypothetical protein [Herbidospora solisilvae]